jgi:hypothetical protein
MRIKFCTTLVSVGLALVAAVPASAVPYQFTLSGPFGATWTADSNPIVDQAGFDSFVLQDVSGDYSGIPGNGPTTNLADIQFYSSSIGGGFFIYNFANDIGLLTTNSAQLFSGTTLNPTFVTGSFALTDFDNEGVSFNLDITDLTSAAPETPTWAMMILGLGMAGAALRSRRSGHRITNNAV